MTDRGQTRALEALQMQRERRRPPQAFTARYHDDCVRCASPIEPGDTVHYIPEGLVHHQHFDSPERYVVCGTCHLTKPCECDDDGMGG